MKLGVAEIFEKVASAPNQKERIKLLQHYDNFAMRVILRLAYDPTLVWDFDEGWKPEYKPSIYYDQEGALYQGIRFINKFLVDGYAGLTREKKKVLFVQLLEGLTPADAAMMTTIIKKKFPFKGIGPATVKEAYPGLLEEPHDAPIL